jgi:hypothetical protein
MSKMWGLHRMENCGLKCSFCGGLGHNEECCWKKKDIKMDATTTSYLEVMINDEKTIQC